MAQESEHYIGHRQRLRERFLNSKGEHFPDYELLELILFSAKPRGDVKPLAKRLLKHFGSFEKVIQADTQELKRIEDVGDAVISSLKAVDIAAQRMVRAPATKKTVLSSWDALLDYCRLAMGNEKIEQFRILFLDHKNNLIADEVQQRGTVNHAPVYPREVLKRALELNASSLILAHNHPSGDATPSQADIDMTHKIISTCAAVNINVHDHLIIAGSEHYSFKAFGII